MQAARRLSIVLLWLLAGFIIFAMFPSTEAIVDAVCALKGCSDSSGKLKLLWLLHGTYFAIVFLIHLILLWVFADPKKPTE